MAGGVVTGNLTRVRSEHAEAILQAESISRRDESRASLFARKAQRDPNNARFRELADKYAADAKASSDELTRLHDTVLPRDYEGTRADFTDRFGNMAANAPVANSGGTGMIGSNSVKDGSAPAQTPEEALEGVVLVNPTQVVGVTAMKTDASGAIVGEADEGELPEVTSDDIGNVDQGGAESVEGDDGGTADEAAEPRTRRRRS